MQTIDAIIETPGGSAVKYNYEPESGFFKVKKVLPVGMVFPHDFGFIPATRGGDGDPLDLMVISEFNTFTGCKMECRLIGTIRATQALAKAKQPKIRNDRIIGISIHSAMFSKIISLGDLPMKMIKELEAFFIQYNKMEDKIFTIQGHLSPAKSYKLIASSGV